MNLLDAVGLIDTAKTLAICYDPLFPHYSSNTEADRFDIFKSSSIHIFSTIKPRSGFRFAAEIRPGRSIPARLLMSMSSWRLAPRSDLVSDDV